MATKLKALYTAVEEEPIPDMFLDLLEKLDQAEQLGKPRS
ncbi:NepR family anti-sigma factor [Pararhizobium sp. O133]